MKKVGRLTLAVALIGLGVLLVLDNFTQLGISWWVGRSWPVLLILLGLEWIWTANRAEAGEPVRMDKGAVIMLIVVAFIASAVGSFWGNGWMGARPGRPRPIPPRPPRVEVVPSIPGLPGLSDISGTATQTFDQPVAGLKEIDLETSSARVEMTAGDTFRVELQTSAFGRDEQEAEANARQMQLVVTPGPSTRVRAEQPGWLSRFGATFRVTVPQGVAVRVRASSGSVLVSDVTADVNVQTSSGSAEIRNAGNVTVTASSGSVRVSSPKGIVRANATSGSLVIEQPARDVSAQTSSGLLTLETAQVGGNYDLSASSGSVRVVVPQDASVAVDARASSGTVRGPQWLVIGEGHGSGTGATGSGEHKLTLRTSSGSILIDQR